MFCSCYTAYRVFISLAYICFRCYFLVSHLSPKINSCFKSCPLYGSNCTACRYNSASAFIHLYLLICFILSLFILRRAQANCMFCKPEPGTDSVFFESENTPCSGNAAGSCHSLDYTPTCLLNGGGIRFFAEYLHSVTFIPCR